MSAELLRKAATILRERAEAATPGPWRVCAEGSEGSRIAPDCADKRERSRFIGVLNGRVQPEDGRNAAYIATMHPGAGLALADWLEDEVHRAKYREDQQADMNLSRVRDEPFPAYYDRSTKLALEVARLIVGGDA